MGDFIKFFKILPFETILKRKTLIFVKISENVSIFWLIFWEKFGPIEQHPPPPSSFLKMQ